MYPGRMRTTDPEATAAKQNRLVEARAAARKALTGGGKERLVGCEVGGEGRKQGRTAGDDDSGREESESAKLEEKTNEPDSLEEGRVEIVARDDDLDQDEESAQRHSHEAVDEGSVEGCGRSERRREGERETRRGQHLGADSSCLSPPPLHSKEKNPNSDSPEG